MTGQASPSRWWVGALGLFLGALAYAELRYGVFKGDGGPLFVPYITNKALSVVATLVICASLLPGRTGTDAERAGRRRAIGLTGLALALAHGALSVPLYSPAIFEKLYDGAALSPRGLAVTVLGVLATATCLAMGALSGRAPAPPSIRRALRWLGWTTVGLTVAHCAVIGIPGWWRPSTWPGSLPPITLLVVLGLVAMVAWGFRRRAG